MKGKILFLLLINGLVFSAASCAQGIDSVSPIKTGWFSLGVRNTISTFGEEGSGIGTGGQFRI